MRGIRQPVAIRSDLRGGEQWKRQQGKMVGEREGKSGLAKGGRKESV